MNKNTWNIMNKRGYAQLMLMLISKATQCLISTKCQFAHEYTTNDNKEKSAVSSHDDHHEQVTDE